MLSARRPRRVVRGLEHQNVCCGGGCYLDHHLPSWRSSCSVIVSDTSATAERLEMSCGRMLTCSPGALGSWYPPRRGQRNVSRMTGCPDGGKSFIVRRPRERSGSAVTWKTSWAPHHPALLECAYLLVRIHQVRAAVLVLLLKRCPSRSLTVSTVPCAP